MRLDSRAVLLYRPHMTAQLPATAAPKPSSQPQETILIVDFGSQVTQLIARRVREAGVYSEIAPFNAADAAFDRLKPSGIILGGGPASVADIGSPRAPQRFFEAGVPILGICYGQQTMCQQLGGSVTPSQDSREFGRAFIEIKDRSALFDGLWKEGEAHQVWMSHGDTVSYTHLTLPTPRSTGSSRAASSLAAGPLRSPTSEARARRSAFSKPACRSSASAMASRRCASSSAGR